MYQRRLEFICDRSEVPSKILQAAQLSAVFFIRIKDNTNHAALIFLIKEMT